MPRKLRSAAVTSVHEMMSDLHKAGIIDKTTMREFDEACLTPIVTMKPETIRRLRKRERASQAVFARFLNVPVSLVSQWERGEKHPNGPSLKLLSLVQKNGLAMIA
jgi:putative transcriptional regulator